MQVFRLLKHKYSSDPLSGDGARINGGRWNSEGNSMLYTSDSISLAALEILVHIHLTTALNAYTCITITLSDEHVMILEDNDLPSDWRDDPVPSSTMSIGEQWLDSNASLALSVPSTLIPQQRNFIINPNHSDFKILKDELKVENFVFDSRLIES